MIDLLSGACSISFLIQPRLSCLGMVLPMVGWAILQELAMEKMPPQTYPQASLMEATLQLRFLLPMCVKLTTKVGMAISNSISVTIETKKGREVGEGVGRERETEQVKD